MKGKIIIYTLALGAAITAGYSCSSVLDKKDLGAITDQTVWTDPQLMTAYVNNIYTDVPNWNADLSGWADESHERTAVNNGTMSADNNPLWYWPYANIRKINSFLENTADNPALGAALKARLTGEVKFIRAFQYFEMVKRFGGVPIVTTAQTLEDDLNVPRNKTSECIAFIIKDLDEAAAVLPKDYSGSAANPGTYGQADKGRATKGAAMALKGRVLLYYASPQFNPGNLADRWEQAYQANKAAADTLAKYGIGLYEDYRNLFLDEMNKEVVFAIRFNAPGRTQNRDACVRPISVSLNCTGKNKPTQELVDAYPLANGKDPDAATPKQQLWANRDARFRGTIVYNGDQFFSRPQWTYKNSGIDAFGASNGTATGYYSRKGINENLTASEATASGTDFIEMRYAEVLMNLAEAANETGRTAEAYDVLKLLRQRAKIEAGADGLYGLDAAMGVPAMRTRLQKERFVEFAFEQKRFWDLRRWRMLHTQLNGKRRHGLAGTKTNDAPLTFTYEIVDVDLAGDIVFNQNIYFAPMNRTEIRNNPKLLQTLGWEDGTFDPLQ
ncbi:RagB/SusD family nutrient uptake outer membrane protein [Chitinophaga barathri]|uniref:RagB/SusD family nutrient uptake outer membrane protein n=1 Tax=Chitinophaga barathri TaxID=1647451 RepID=A0A3N4MBT0_9BACT|nr:RagB/SusD family nutrient uptake outer membrane protein [Chitinophaga barathri]RPD41101.1 RagB/SusD family nutrient uptake outer membrane protein [Chitinophaga barathri]